MILFKVIFGLLVSLKFLYSIEATPECNLDFYINKHTNFNLKRVHHESINYPRFRLYHYIIRAIIIS